jgi:hypothetical protein
MSIKRVYLDCTLQLLLNILNVLCVRLIHYLYQSGSRGLKTNKISRKKPNKLLIFI